MKRTYKYQKKIEKCWESGLDLVFPPRCPVCDKPVPPTELICPACREKFVEVKAPLCLKCGKQIRDDREEYCRGCRLVMHEFERGRGLFTYRSMAESMYRFKYAGRREYARFYGEQIVRRLGKTIRGWKPDALIPVPVHSSRKRERGYNQAEVLAKEIGKKMDIPVERRLLKRVKKTVPQKLLDDKGRQNNLKRAFKICRNDVKLKVIVMIDDIYTTGSTIDACAAVLKSAGVEKVYYITAAIGKELL
ncbi:MAG: ComF family protein [Lachnospiraceae bacterium]|jgi:ComF family protein|nr:ComF family protein [Lachnospiraceae bacterium]